MTEIPKPGYRVRMLDGETIRTVLSVDDSTIYFDNDRKCSIKNWQMFHTNQDIMERV